MKFFDYIPKKGKTVTLAGTKFTGAPQKPIAVTFCFLGAVNFALAYVVWAIRSNNSIGTYFCMLISLLTGCSGTAIGLLLLYLNRDIRRSKRVSELSHKYGLSEEQISEIAETQGAIPAYNIKGTLYYKPDQLDISTLVRPANAPNNVNELLRVANGGDDNETEDLLRPSGESSSDTKMYKSAEEALVQLAKINDVRF